MFTALYEQFGWVLLVVGAAILWVIFKFIRNALVKVTSLIFAIYGILRFASLLNLF
ncbi:hypothetical protein MHH81_20505 [Psychrobacillus sp. FSL H8-0484]|uniref:hypothetical protein n=1 Tax=Psychrobacillus sp. FSL H8-0484 TaxID=2921390 RepID=UPI0030FA13FD